MPSLANGQGVPSGVAVADLADATGKKPKATRKKDAEKCLQDVKKMIFT